MEVFNLLRKSTRFKKIFTLLRKSTRLKAALYEFSIISLKEGSTGTDFSLQTPFAAAIVGPPLGVLSARTVVTILEETVLSSSVEEACSKERIFSSMSPGDLAAMKLRMTFINAGEKSRLEGFPAVVVAITCLNKLRTISFCFRSDSRRSIFLRRVKR